MQSWEVQCVRVFGTITMSCSWGFTVGLRQRLLMVTSHSNLSIGLLNEARLGLITIFLVMFVFRPNQKYFGQT